MHVAALNGRNPFRWLSPCGLFLAFALLMIGNQAAFAAVTVNPPILPAGTQGVAYDETVTGSGGSGPYSFSVTLGALPTGITLNGATGDLTGTPSAQGVYNFTIQATDSLSATGSRAYTVAVGTFSLAVQPNTLPNGTQGVAYNQTLTAVGGNPPYTFSVSSGALPTGVSLASDGTMSGTPSAAGAYTFIIQASDGTGDTGFRTYSNVVIGGNVLTIAPPTLPNGTQGTAYSQTVTASGGTGGPYIYSVSAGTLPSGLSLNTSTGLIGGTPSAGGSFNFTIRAVDGNNNFGTQAYTVVVGANSLTINPASLPNGTVTTAYSQIVTASGGTGGPYTYSISSGALPNGLSLNTGSGAITGTPSAGGSFGFNVHAVDGNGNFGNRGYTVNIGTNSLTVTPAALPAGTQGVSYSQTVGATGGTGPYSFAVTSGALPTGLSLNAGTGVIGGTPSASGPFNFTIRATDVNFNTGFQAYTVNIAPVPLTVNPSSLPNGTQSVAYSQTITTSGGTGPFSYAVLSGALPTGLSLNAGSGVISGTPSAAGNYNFTVQSTDSTPNTGSRGYSVTIGTNSLTVNPTGLPNGSQGVGYSQTVTAGGGTGPYAFSVTSGALPTGLSLNAGSGAITGTPSGSGVSNFTIQAMDTVGNIGSRAYAVNIGTSALIVSPASLPNGSQSIAYSQTVTASGGTGTYTFAVISGALPSGLSLNGSTGAITGTPSGSGLSNFTIRATDGNGNTGSRVYAVNIGTTTLTVNAATLPNASQGTAYSQTMTASGGSGPYQLALISGALPAGLSFNAGTGAITGTPTGTGASTFVIQATDINGNIGSRSYTINVGGNSLTINPATLPNAPKGRPYTQMLTVVGGNGPFLFALQTGSLPPGLTFNATTGVITGTPTTAASFTFTFVVHDINGNFGSRAYTLSTLLLDPTTDPEVQGLVAAQATMARQFTDAQTSNVLRHLEGLHDNFNPCGLNFGINASTYNAPPSAYPSDPTAGSAFPPVNKDPLPPPRPATPASTCDPSGPPIAIWASGAMEFGRMTSTGLLVDSTKFSTSGLTAGIDVHAADQLVVGAAVGYGVDHTDIGLRGSVSDANNLNGIAYASYKPAESVFVDAVVGYGSLNFNNTRWVDLDNTSVAGKRDGSAWFGSISVSTDFRRGALKFSPYVRLDAMSARLDQYSEAGDVNAALTYQATNISSIGGAVGLRGSLDICDGADTYTPTMRLEYKRAFDGGFTQMMYYNQTGPGTLYALNQDGTTRNLFTGALGLRARFGTAATLDLEYSLTATPSGDTSWQSQMIRAIAHWNFEAN
jgi:uncharacterized protein YhjY with autotransporter beta-barrel domain